MQHSQEWSSRVRRFESPTPRFLNGLPGSETRSLSERRPDILSSGLQRARLFRGPGRNIVHQRWRQTVVGLELQLSKAPADPIHPSRIDARFDRRRHESRKARRRPAGFLKTLGVNEVQPFERMVGLDRSVHVNAALDAGMALYE